MTATMEILSVDAAEDRLVTMLMFAAELRCWQDTRYDEYSKKADALALLIANALSGDQKVVAVPKDLLSRKVDPT